MMVMMGATSAPADAAAALSEASLIPRFFVFHVLALSIPAVAVLILADFYCPFFFRFTFFSFTRLST